MIAGNAIAAIPPPAWCLYGRAAPALHPSGLLKNLQATFALSSFVRLSVEPHDLPDEVEEASSSDAGAAVSLPLPLLLPSLPPRFFV